MATAQISMTDGRKSVELWEKAWREHWGKTGFSAYELHVARSDDAREERNLLMHGRTVHRERTRLKQIMAEFENGFRQLYKLGPAVTVFGSARFAADHPSYRLACQVGRRLAEAGLTLVTGRGTFNCTR